MPDLLRSMVVLVLAVGACQLAPGAVVNAGAIPARPALTPQQSAGAAVSAAASFDPMLTLLAAEYRAIRAEPRSPANDQRKGALMDQLGRHLGDGTHTRADVTLLMGPPDEIAVPGSLIFAFVSVGRRPPRGKELLVYHARGGHDLVYFDCDGPAVLGSGWWMAGD
jgi:hypothetical protein